MAGWGPPWNRVLPLVRWGKHVWGHWRVPRVNLVDSRYSRAAGSEVSHPWLLITTPEDPVPGSDGSDTGTVLYGTIVSQFF